MNAERPTGAYLAPRMSPARIDRTWGAIAQRRGSRARTVWTSGIFAAVLALGVCVFLLRDRATASTATPQAGFTLASEDAPEALDLPDGTRIELGRAAHIVFQRSDPAEQRIVLDRGMARFRVTHLQARRFVVVVGDVEVIDVGTEFTISREGERQELVRVSVVTGEVEVRVGGKNARLLRAGESLATPERVARLDPPAPEVDEPPPAAPSAKTATVSAAPAVEVTAKSLLAEATAARESGNTGAEVQALESLRRRFPNDPRAQMAAFELGRIRSDQLGDQAGALEALQAASDGKSSSKALKEDAEARRIGVLSQLNKTAECRAARSAFLAKYPSSAHLATVRALCPSP